jgi:drug/metabolite transporter (DMT)-like permease
VGRSLSRIPVLFASFARIIAHLLHIGIGEYAALTAAMLWTFSSMIWGSFRLSASQMNLLKNLLGAAMVLIHLTLVNSCAARPLFAAGWESWGWLGLSGLIGLAIGDTFFFRALQILGPRRALMLATTSPIFAVIAGWLLLGEQLYWLTVAGVLLAVFGVGVVLGDRRAQQESPGLLPGTMRAGIIAGGLAAVCQAVGAVFSKMAMQTPEGLERCDPLEATFIRLLLSGLMILVVTTAKREILALARTVIRDKLVGRLLLGTAMGTWMGIGLSMLAYSKADIGVAQTLMSTCPLFAIPVLWLTQGQKFSAKALLGTAIALAGIAMVVWKWNF